MLQLIGHKSHWRWRDVSPLFDGQNLYYVGLIDEYHGVLRRRYEPVTITIMKDTPAGDSVAFASVRRPSYMISSEEELDTWREDVDAVSALLDEMYAPKN